MTDASQANAAPMPALSRRNALGSLAAASVLLAVPSLANALSDDADVFAAIEHFKTLYRAQEAAGDRCPAAC